MNFIQLWFHSKMQESNQIEDLINRVKNLTVSEPKIQVIATDKEFKVVQGEYKSYKDARDSFCELIRQKWFSTRIPNSKV